MDYSILIGGAAGQGIETVVELLEKIIKRSGFNIFTYKDYMSMVRGGHNFMQIRFSENEIFTYNNEIDLLFAMTAETITIHKDKVKTDGIIICDENFEDNDVIKLPFDKLVKELGDNRAIGTIGVGFIVKYFGIEYDIAVNTIKTVLKDKNVELNLAAFKAGYEIGESKFKLESLEDNKILINGNQALALGAIAAGVKFYCGYPMTPSTSVMSYISKHANEMNIVVDQVEDEVAALNMALGASYAGVRAMTGSSGGGFALMVEALSLAGIMEIPIVLFNAQRPGPATGLSTRSEQADLRFVIHAGHGEFPKMVIALRNPEDAFYQTARAFNLADKYQIPVILLTDEYLADYEMTVKPFDFSRITIERYITNESEIEDERYKRYKYTDSGISPRLIPGIAKEKLVLVDSHEHNEYGNIDESIETRVNMMKKRMKKLELLKEEIKEPEYIGTENPEVLLVGFGSTYGAIKESILRLNSQDDKFGALIFGDIYPFPIEKLNSYAKKAKKIIVIEQNYLSQLKSLIDEYTDIKVDKSILKYDGRAINSDDIILEINKFLSNDTI
ncbi:2-oxoacid:acceptor oxidoreductase subunit alpha [Soehngenia longivitae]|uniref:2-oxoacid:acceptor oxidoreductase subunit alpha n=1 Tax=Soehngenia longivitae TaxID=2562294 RepID=A0A4Z0D5U1_9FIRM|nr:2-oxoacid:acceptor oxidoreductase subunit alpha [Soehngenia longivitae]TFZ40251.1 2-oxoacid:acceptor oxidoreductase subunit alpha [Soehngenia longivitae]